MAEIADVAAYFCINYPHKSELSKTRLTKLVYLADWENAKKTGRQMTPIRWYFHNFGPYVDDVMDAVAQDKRFEVTSTLNSFGASKNLVQVAENERMGIRLSASEKEVLDGIIELTSPMYWNAFIKHVYSTPPDRKVRSISIFEF